MLSKSVELLLTKFFFCSFSIHTGVEEEDRGFRWRVPVPQGPPEGPDEAAVRVRPVLRLRPCGEADGGRDPALVRVRFRRRRRGVHGRERPAA